VEPFRVSVILVNRPFTGAERVTVAGTKLGGAWAQSGTQLSMSEVPWPVAPVAVQEDHWILVTTFPESPLYAISVGFIPV
jgi:hypothetical protein